MTIATLSDIITKVRRLTGTSNSTQLSDSQIIDYINSFYLYDFPSQFKSLNLKDVFTFNTIRNVNTYPFDNRHYTSIEAPAYIDKRLVSLCSSPYPFYVNYFNWQYREILATGDGTTGNYSGTTNNSPIIRSQNNNPMAATVTNPTSTFATLSYPSSFNEPNPSRVQNILITGRTASGTAHATDDGNGNIIGDATGVIDYETGTVSSLVFTSAIVANTSIDIVYNPSNMNRPNAILFFQNQFTLSPTPDKGYQVSVIAYRTPSQILLGSQNPDSINGDGLPELLEWWETLAAGASKKVFEDRQDEDGIMMMDKMLQERYSLNETRTYANIASQRAQTIYSQQFDGIGFNIFGGIGE